MAASGEKTPFLIVYRILLALFLVLALIFLGGTAYGLLFRKNMEVPGASQVQGTSRDPEEHIFTGIGRLRLSTNNSAMVILTVTFPYSTEDRAFSEELAARVRDFRTITEEYFQSASAGELQGKSEEQVKTDLLERFNSVLRLGKIRILYFNDFMILE